jgi:hypothetical protein
LCKIKTTKNCKVVQNKLEENLTGLTIEPCDSINNKWAKISYRIHNVVSELLGSIENHNDWYDEECQIATEKNNKAQVTPQPVWRIIGE